jgi:hypothetical protein
MCVEEQGIENAAGKAGWDTKWQIKWLDLSLRLLGTLRYTLHFILWYLASLWAQRCQLNHLTLYWESVTAANMKRNFTNISVCRRKLYISYVRGICEQRSDISIFWTLVYSAPKREQGTWPSLNYWTWPKLLCLLLKMFRSKTWAVNQSVLQTKLHYIMEDCNPKKY